MTVEFFGVRGMGQIGGLGKTSRTEAGQKSAKSESTENASFSNALQGATASQPGSTTDTERTARIQELKAQISSGEYEPDLNKVASSLLKFLAEG